MSGRAAASDSHFSRSVGFLKFLEIIDKEWLEDSLSDDEVNCLFLWLSVWSPTTIDFSSFQITLSRCHDLPADDGDDESDNEFGDPESEEKWNDFGEVAA